MMVFKTFPITGIAAGKGPDGSVPVRREFVEWSESTDRKDKDQFILFLLALDRLQKVHPSKRESYFQIAGIHGFPYAAWDEPELTQGEVRGTDSSYKGYCMHANAHFPVWHRPYLLLYEQRIYETMINDIIPERPENSRGSWIQTASTWRLPYWDWAKNPMPKMMSSQFFNLSLDGKNTKFRNPLYQFVMPGDEPMGHYGVGNIWNPDIKAWLMYSECHATSRGIIRTDYKDTEGIPDAKRWAEGIVNDAQVTKNVRSHSSITGFDYGTASELVYRLLTYPLDYPHFATLARDLDATSATASTSSVTNDINLEFIHNNVHYWVGGDGGHMSQIPVATFDPVFWFHHCNLDRLFAIWQTLNQDVTQATTNLDGAGNKWFTYDQQRYFDQKIVGGGDIVTNETPLRPFHKDENGTVWMPNDAINWYNLGYTYPELQPWLHKGDDAAKLKQRILQEMNESYGIVRKEVLATSVETQAKIGETDADGNITIKDYAVSIAFKKFAFNGNSFNLEVYIRKETAAAEEKTFAPEEFVTNVFNFSQPASRDGVEAYIPLTSYLIKMVNEGRVDNLQTPTVEQFLKGLYYRVTINGQPVPEEQWATKPEFGLKVDVSVMPLTVSSDPAIQPALGEPEVIPTLGTGPDKGSAVPVAGVMENFVNARKITPLSEPVVDGGSFIITLPKPSTTAPTRETLDVFSLLSLPAGSALDPFDEDAYDFVLSMFVRAKNKEFKLGDHEAKKPYGGDTGPMKPATWIQRENAVIRVDMKPDAFDVYTDGVKLGTMNRKPEMKGRPVTHVRYWVATGKQPVLGLNLSVTTYKTTSLVP